MLSRPHRWFEPMIFDAAEFAFVLVCITYSIERTATVVRVHSAGYPVALSAFSRVWFLCNGIGRQARVIQRQDEFSRVGEGAEVLVTANHELPDLLSSDAFVCPLMVLKFLLSPLSHLWPSGFAYQQNGTKLHNTISGVLPRVALLMNKTA